MKLDWSWPGSVLTWPARRWVTMAVVTAVSALAIGAPTGILRTSFYTRMTPVLWWNYPIWALSATLTGFIAATYVRSPLAGRGEMKTGIGGGALSLLAVGCPVCNKLVVLAVGVTGAMDLWAPIQPLLGVMSLVLLVWAASRRLRGEWSCTMKPGPPVAFDRRL